MHAWDSEVGRLNPESSKKTKRLIFLTDEKNRIINGKLENPNENLG